MTVSEATATATAATRIGAGPRQTRTTASTSAAWTGSSRAAGRNSSMAMGNLHGPRHPPDSFGDNEATTDHMMAYDRYPTFVLRRRRWRRLRDSCVRYL